MGASSAYDELLLGACELAQNGLDDVRWRLNRKRVEEHVRGGSHDEGRAQLSLRGFRG